MAARLHRRKTLQDKIKTIQDVLDGVFVVQRKPYHYNAMQQKDGSYFVSSHDDISAPGFLSEEQFEAWRITLKQDDVLWWCSNLNAPIEEPEELQARYEAERVNEVHTTTQQTDLVELPAKRLRNDRKKKEPDSVLVSVPKRSGSISEYGQSWELDKQKYYLS